MGNLEILTRLDRLMLLWQVEKKPVVLYTASNMAGKETEVTRDNNQNQYPDELKLKEILSQGIPLKIPLRYLHGRQTYSEYSNRKRKLAEKALLDQGISFLLQDPIIACAIPIGNNLKIVIIDGHHRARYASKHSIRDIPSLLYTPQQLTEAFNVRNLTSLTSDQLTEQLQREVAEAQFSFRSLPDHKRPMLINGFRTISELPFERFQFKSQ